MSEHEQPQEGGSFLRGNDGKLTRIIPEADAVAGDPAKPHPRPSTAKDKKDK